MTITTVKPRQAAIEAHIKYLSQRSTMPLAELSAIARNKPRKWNTANGLTTCIVDYLTYIGAWVTRVNVIGRKIQTTAGKEIWIRSATKRGTADVQATYAGLSFQIEVKIGRDSQSDKQKEVAAKVTAAGGYYMIAADFDTWFIEFHSIVDKKRA